nr:HRDC domain-containing protein [Planococcus sp. (in: firmicutes)]
LRKGAVVTKKISSNDPLFEELRVVRKKLADEAGVPPFVIFSDKALQDMVARRPKNEVEFLEVNGVGANKLEKYGQAFLQAIHSFDAINN